MTNPYQQQYPPQYPPSNGYPGQAGTPAAPGSVKGAFLIYVIAALVVVVTVVLTLTSSVWDEAITANPTTSGIDPRTLVNTVKIIAVVAAVIFVALYLFFAFKMRAGRNWARIVLTVLSGLSILSSASASAQVNVNGTIYRSTTSQSFSWIGTALAVVAIVLMFLPASNAYFTASKAARQQGVR